MLNLSKKSKLIMGVLLISTLFLICQMNLIFGQEKKSEKGEFVIGALFSVTGQQSFLGDPEKKTAEMLAEQLNAKGGINGTPVKLIVYDTEGDALNAKNKAKKLIEVDKVDAVIGPTNSGPSLAIIQEFEKAQIPLVSCAASIKIVQPINKWVFKTAQSDMHAVIKISQYMKTKEIKKVAIITVSNAFGDSGKEQLIAILPEEGIEIVAKESFGNNDTDVTAQLTKIKGTDAQAVICWGTNPGPAVVAKNMKQLGMKIPLIQSHGVASQKFIELAGDAAEGIVLPAGKLIVADLLPDSDPQKATLLQYTKEYKAKYNSPVSTFGGHAWDAFMLVTKAMEKVGKDKEKIRREIEKSQNFVGITGIFNMNENDHNGLNEDAFTMVEIKNGKWALAK